MDFQPATLLAIASGVVIAATCGLRAFLPLFALGLVARFTALPLHEATGWLRSDVALISLGVATLAEILGDKIPVVDHVLDAVGLAVRPLAAAFGSFALLQGVPEPWSALIAITLGGFALGVQGVKAKARLGSSALTLGTANPLLSFAEDALALLGTALALLAPIVALIGVLLVLAWVTRRASRRPQDAARPLATRP
ncbi:MAG: DUF4126 domain-containing protein [Candidatus Eisenbacteria bacterium]|uniref:DUF4126 domain-containing protein n=1 Tax=Eiseniibacteriota bacterium TaxID=2212470 RepID=A0A849SJW9_UNCEI|nr:DUF4126 domain-containing protein [Candidatus Eisenbacteria bacterium]